MPIRRFTGERILPLMIDSDAQLERNRFVKVDKATNKVSYTGYGDFASGVTRIRSNDDNFDTTVLPLDFADTTFFVEVASNVSVGSPIFPIKNGFGVTKSYSVKSMSVLANPGSPEEGDAYIVNGAGWTEETAGSIAIYDGAEWEEITLEDAESLVVFNEADGKYYLCDGEKWVETKIAAYSGGIGSPGSSVVCYNVEKSSVVTRESLPSELNQMGKIVATGKATVLAAETSVEIASGDFKATDIVVATLQSAVNSVYVTKAVAEAGKVTLTVSGVPGAGGGIVGYIVIRTI